MKLYLKYIPNLLTYICIALCLLGIISVLTAPNTKKDFNNQLRNELERNAQILEERRANHG